MLYSFQALIIRNSHKFATRKRILAISLNHFAYVRIVSYLLQSYLPLPCMHPAYAYFAFRPAYWCCRCYFMGTVFLRPAAIWRCPSIGCFRVFGIRQKAGAATYMQHRCVYDHDKVYVMSVVELTLNSHYSLFITPSVFHSRHKNLSVPQKSFPSQSAVYLWTELNMDGTSLASVFLFFVFNF